MPSKDFDYTGTWQRWNVPDRVEWVEVTLVGAGSDGVPGGRVTGRINVKNRKSLHILVGQKGKRAGERTFGGGGAGGLGHGLGDGFSGGGATWVRMNSRTGALKAVAGGAGGSSGDGGKGGEGGGDVGGAGSVGSLATGAVGNATGGTQIQGGNGGSSSAGTDLAGGSANDTNLSRGGDGASPTRANTTGGGGGGGGYRGGGGGQAGLQGETPGGGGGGGSNYIGGLTGYTNTIGGGATGNGSATLTWVTPGPANQPPTAPSEVKIGGEDYLLEMTTLAKHKVKVSAKVNDPDNTDDVRLIVIYSPDSSFAQTQRVTSDWVNRGKRATVELTNLSQNTLWYARAYTRDRKGLVSVNYTALRFWTNRAPDAPNLTSPGDNATLSDLDSVVFAWTFADPDHPETPVQRGFNLQWRRAGTPLFPAGDWHDVTYTVRDSTYVGEPEDFKASTTYEWRVRTQDERSLWGPWSEIRSFYISGESAPPWPTAPVGDEAVEMADGTTFSWMFRDPTADAAQTYADLRYRAAGTQQWIQLSGDPLYPGPVQEWYLGPDALPAGHWEWQVRTYAGDGATASDWSDSESFWLVRTPGATVEPVVPRAYASAVLGQGNNEVHVYRRGGQIYCGKIGGISELTWTRKRDDIGGTTLTTTPVDRDTAALLRDTHCWTHELVVYRDGERVMEGPITRLTDSPTGYAIEAGDVMRYVYRRNMRQGYNDAYRIINNVQLGSRSVVQRGRQIIMNGLAPDDPNVLAYLTTYDFPDDARESRSVPDFAKTAWEELDSLAATAGLDYAVAGRRIILNDTHRPIGRLPELRTEHFSDPPVVSEYGMLLATDFAVTNNNGIYGLASRRTAGEVGPYGLVEMLASAYGEDQGGGSVETMDSESQANLERTLAEQAQRNIANRWPTPLVVRVPDNSMLMPDTPVKINHLIPGVWIPLRAQGTVREVAQWQKLDVLTVTQDRTGEKVMVTMSPAPNAGADPDAEGETEGSGL